MIGDSMTKSLTVCRLCFKEGHDMQSALLSLSTLFGIETVELF